MKRSSRGTAAHRRFMDKGSIHNMCWHKGEQMIDEVVEESTALAAIKNGAEAHAASIGGTVTETEYTHAHGKSYTATRPIYNVFDATGAYVTRYYYWYAWEWLTDMPAEPK